MAETNKPDPKPDSKSGPELRQELDQLVEGAAGLFESLKEIFLKSKDEVVRASRLGKTRIDLFQLEKDREHFVMRLGEEAFELVKAGKLSDPALQKPYEKIVALDTKRAEYEAEVTRIADEQLAAAAATEAAVAEATAKTQGIVDAMRPAEIASPEPRLPEPEPHAAPEPTATGADGEKLKKAKKPKKDL
jgi:hypothetical protein